LPFTMHMELDDPRAHAFDATALGMAVLRAGTIVAANAALGRIAKTDEASLIGLSLETLIPSGALGAERRLQCADGSYRWVRATVAAFGATHEVVTLEDVDTDVRRREVVASAERLHRAMLHSLPDCAVLAFDEALRCVMAIGDETLEAAGYSQSLIGRRVREIAEQSSVTMLERIYTAALQGQTTTREVSRNGRLFLVRVGPMYDEQGAVIGGLTLARDIGAEKRFEQRLVAIAEAQQDSNSVAVWRVDYQLRLTSHNAAFEELHVWLFGSPPRGGELQMLRPDPHWAGWEDSYLRALGGEAHSIVHEYARDTQSRLLSLHFSPCPTTSEVEISCRNLTVSAHRNSGLMPIHALRTGLAGTSNHRDAGSDLA
jgi:PAS domain S-box-containing protein